MAEPKTARNKTNPNEFINSIEHEKKRTDSLKILSMMEEISGCKPEMWGASIVGFDTYEMTYANGKKGTWPKIGFSPRKQALTLYVGEFDGKEELLSALGKYKTGKSCLYIKKLDDVDEEILKEVIKTSLENFEGGC